MQKIIKTEHSDSEISIDNIGGNIAEVQGIIVSAVINFADRHKVDPEDVQIRFFEHYSGAGVEFSVDREETDEEFEARVVEVRKHKKKKICDSIRSLKKSITLMEEAGLGSENAELALEDLMKQRDDLQRRMNDFS